MDEQWRETSHAHLGVRDDGVAVIRHHDGVHHTHPLAAEQIVVFRELLAGRKAPLMVVVGRDFEQDDDARELLLRGDEIGQTFTRAALVMSGRVEQMAVSVFLRLQRTIVPIRAFRDEASALRWLL